MVDAVYSGVTVTIDSSANSQIAGDGTITFSSSSVTGDVIFRLTKNAATDTQVVPITVPAHTATDVVSATISPATVTFDKNPSGQADVSTTIIWNDAASVTDIKKAGVSIEASVYSISENTLTIKKNYLSTQPTGSLVLTIEFDQGNAATLTITVQDTTQPISNPPTWPAGSTLTASGTTRTRTTLSWTAATDDVGVTILQDF